MKDADLLKLLRSVRPLNDDGSLKTRVDLHRCVRAWLTLTEAGVLSEHLSRTQGAGFESDKRAFARVSPMMHALQRRGHIPQDDSLAAVRMWQSGCPSENVVCHKPVRVFGVAWSAYCKVALGLALAEPWFLLQYHGTTQMAFVMEAAPAF